MKKSLPLPPSLESAFYDSTLEFFNRKDVPFYIGMTKRIGGPVLELGCGTGRMLIPLAKKGFDVTGVDLSPMMVSTCRRKLAREASATRSRVRLECCDMRCFGLRREFRLVIIPYCTFQFLTSVKDQLACLKSVGRHLLPGGKLVFDLFNPNLPRMLERQNRVLGNVGPRFRLADGGRVVRRGRIREVDPHKQIMEIESVSDVRGPGMRTERYVKYLRLRFIYRFEAEHLLARAGFRLEKVFGDFDKSSFNAGNSRNMILVAVKTGRQHGGNSVRSYQTSERIQRQPSRPARQASGRRFP